MLCFSMSYMCCSMRSLYDGQQSSFPLNESMLHPLLIKLHLLPLFSYGLSSNRPYPSSSDLHTWAISGDVCGGHYVCSGLDKLKGSQSSLPRFVRVIFSTV